MSSRLELRAYCTLVSEVPVRASPGARESCRRCAISLRAFLAVRAHHRGGSLSLVGITACGRDRRAFGRRGRNLRLGLRRRLAIEVRVVVVVVIVVVVVGRAPVVALADGVGEFLPILVRAVFL